MNMTVTNVDNSSVEAGQVEHRDEKLTFAGAATELKGTILARDSVSLKMVPFVKGGVTNENGIPKTVLGYEVTAAGAGDVTIRPIVQGKVRREQLVISADGDGSNIDDAVLDQLRDYQITPLDVNELNILDNQ
ncbi:MAG: head decoration protein [Gammaproteobacteria bacterium]|nr:head decoration protein [Gammaproteobacteria bacterium]